MGLSPGSRTERQGGLVTRAGKDLSPTGCPISGSERTGDGWNAAEEKRKRRREKGRNVREKAKREGKTDRKALSHRLFLGRSQSSMRQTYFEKRLQTLAREGANGAAHLPSLSLSD